MFVNTLLTLTVKGKLMQQCYTLVCCMYVCHLFATKKRCKIYCSLSPTVRQLSTSSLVVYGQCLHFCLYDFHILNNTLLPLCCFPFLCLCHLQFHLIQSLSLQMEVQMFPRLHHLIYSYSIGIFTKHT